MCPCVCLHARTRVGGNPVAQPRASELCVRATAAALQALVDTLKSVDKDKVLRNALALLRNLCSTPQPQTSATERRKRSAHARTPTRTVRHTNTHGQAHARAHARARTHAHTHTHTRARSHTRAAPARRHALTALHAQVCEGVPS